MGTHRTKLAVFAFVALTAFLRMPGLVFEEPALYTAGPNPLEPQSGYFQILGRSAFLVARLLGEPVVTRIVAAAIVGLVAAYVWQAGWLWALGFGLLPTAFPDGYLGPLNGQWWLAVGLVVMALRPIRAWHYPAIVLAGFSGLAPCVMLPVFRDRRGLVLAAVTGVQALSVLAGERRPVGWAIGPEFTLVMVLLLAVMIVARLPPRAKLALAYAGLSLLVLGAVEMGDDWHQRYLTVAWAAIFLGVGSWLAQVQGEVAALVRRQDADIRAAGVRPRDDAVFHEDAAPEDARRVPG